MNPNCWNFVLCGVYPVIRGSPIYRPEWYWVVLVPLNLVCGVLPPVVVHRIEVRIWGWAFLSPLFLVEFCLFGGDE